MSIQNLAGQTLGQYELREMLGAGGMGAVYRAYQPSLKRQVAIKVLAAQLVEQPGALERFNREAQTSAALEHSNIICIYDYGTQRGISYLVMQLLTGGSLQQRIAERTRTGQPLPSLGEIAGLLYQMGSALDYAHSQGVIHRDIKPSNVMFDQQGNAFLVDFGIARLIQATMALTAPGVLIGTWGYMAPEQWQAGPLVPATDQYALAVMAYALAAGQMPFDAPTPAGVMRQHLHETPPPLHTRRAGIPPAVTQVVERALSKNPEDRFPSVTGFAQAFNQAIQGSTGQRTSFFTSAAFRPPADTGSRLNLPVSAALPWYKKNWVWGMALALIVAAAVGVIVLLGGRDQGKVDLPALVGQIASPTPTVTATDLPPTQADNRLVIITPTASPTLTATETPDVTLTPSLTATCTPTATATPTATLTPTPTALPSATPTPDLDSTVEAMFSQMLTLTATAWTATPTPDVGATANVLLAQALTGTAAGWTNTPVPTPTEAAPLPTATPLPTETPLPTVTITPTRTPTPTRVTPTPGPLPAEISTGDILNLRAGPGTEYPVVRGVRPGVQFLLTTYRGDWAYTRIDDSYGWLALSYLRYDGSLSSLPSPDELGIDICPPPGSALGSAWAAVHWRLGCATGSAQSMTGTSQPYTGGVMIWRGEPKRRVYAILNDGRWTVHPEAWTSDAALSCSGTYVSRGFGQVYCDYHLSSVIGSPTAPERPGSTLVVQEFEHGIILQIDGAGTQVLLDDTRGGF